MACGFHAGGDRSAGPAGCRIRVERRGLVGTWWGRTACHRRPAWAGDGLVGWPSPSCTRPEVGGRCTFHRIVPPRRMPQVLAGAMVARVQRAGRGNATSSVIIITNRESLDEAGADQAGASRSLGPGCDPRRGRWRHGWLARSPSRSVLEVPCGAGAAGIPACPAIALPRPEMGVCGPVRGFPRTPGSRRITPCGRPPGQPPGLAPEHPVYAALTSRRRGTPFPYSGPRGRPSPIATSPVEPSPWSLR